MSMYVPREQRLGIVQYWGGCPDRANSKWHRFVWIVEQCAARGWHTHLVWSKMPDDPEMVRPLEESACRIVILPRAAGNLDPGCIWRAYRLFSAVKCDVVHCHNYAASPLIGAALAGVRVRVWSALAMSRFYEERTSPHGLHRLSPTVRVCGALAHRTLCISRAVHDELLAAGVPSGKLSVVPAPIDVDRYGHGTASGVRSAVGLDDGDFVITTVGCAFPVKGWDILVQAFAALSTRLPHARLLLVGSTDGSGMQEMARRLHAMTRELGVCDKVRFAGPRDDIPNVLAASDVFVFPSRSEGQGLALTEALAAGLPVVAAAVGGIPELVEHRGNGLLFPREDVETLTQSLIELAHDAALRRRLGDCARSSAKRFDMGLHTRFITDLYGSLMNQHTRRTSPPC